MTGVVTRNRFDVMSAPAAATAAGISYRQLDHWERQGWITASKVDGGAGGGRRVRWYDNVVVARLAALRHLAQSGYDVAVYGPQIDQVDLEAHTGLVVGGDPEQLATIDLDQVVDVVTEPGRWTVFDPTPYLDAAEVDDQADDVVSIPSERKSA